jgi:hypothetical protein
MQTIKEIEEYIKQKKQLAQLLLPYAPNPIVEKRIIYGHLWDFINTGDKEAGQHVY